jgi:hypothetical protein
MASVSAQNNVGMAMDSIQKGSILNDSIPISVHQDSVAIVGDTNLIAQDTTLIAPKDTNQHNLPTSPNAVTSVIDYYAQDSLSFDLRSSKALLYHQANLDYDDANLKAYYVEINFAENELYAKGEPDTSGVLQETPVFRQGSYEVKSHEIRYNFSSKRGLLRNVITQEGESYLHGSIVKKNEDNTSYIRYGKYTTCNLESPHYEVSFGKAKVIPDDKVVTGPLFVRLASIPLIPLPFGMFPNSSKHTNGLLLPTYGNRFDLGPHLSGLGYYFVIKDRIDFSLTTDLYMRGAFGLGLKSNYIKRYKFNGNYDISYAFTPSGERTTKEYKIQHDFKVYWRHQQDRKAHPTNSFSANIDFKTQTYSKNHVEEKLADYTQSKAMSVVNFSTSFKSRYSLGVNAELSQDLIQGNLDMKLPQINFGISQFYPFRRKKVIGKLRWYENISMQYTLDLQNTINTYDSVLVKDFKHAFDNFRLGASHSIPVKSIVKLFKHINWTNSISLTETWQMKGSTQSWGEYDSTTYNYVARDTVYKFYPAHTLAFSSGLSTTLYGMYILKKGRVSAFRHTLTPSVSFSYRPSINKHLYSTYYDTIQREHRRYSYIQGWLYGTPDYKASGRIDFSLSNRLEMKIRSKKDDGEAFKKVVIFENIGISTGYDFFRDSLRLDPLSVNGRTTLFKYIIVSFDLKFDPYTIDTNGRRINKLELNENGRLFRLSTSAFNLSFALNINKELFQKKDREEKTEKKSPSGFGEWNVSLNYIFSYNMADNPDHYLYQRFVDTIISKYTHRLQNSLNMTGSIALTPKWTLNFTTGYNFTDKKISASEFVIERDLHCWVMSFRWIPFGSIRSFEVGIRAKASILRDAKYDKRRELRD